MPVLQSTPIAILGAGLTGLSAAVSCQRAGLDYRLFERESETGGLARTTQDSGYSFDRTGHLLHSGTGELRQDILDWLGHSALTLERQSVIWSHGVYTDYPFQANTYGLPAKVVRQCVLGFFKARFRRQPVIENFEQYCRAHFGEGFSEHFMLPYNRRLWGVEPSEITPQWCDRYVPLPTVSDVLRGALGRKPRALGYNQRFFYPKAGIGELARRLTQQLIHVELNRAPLSINYATRQLTFRDQTLSYQHLISSIPLNRLLTLCGALPSEVEQAKHKLRCTHLYYLDVALSETCGKPFHWVYVPEARYPFYRVGCYSNFSAQMAPRGSAGLYVELAARSEPDLNKLLPQVAAGLVEMGMISSPGAIRFARVRRIEHAYVIFDQDYAAATTAAHAFLSEHGITSTGRYGEWTYSSMTDALSCGRSAVRAIACTK